MEEASTRREQPAGGEDGDECTPEDKVGRAPGLGGHPLAQPCPVYPVCPTASLQEQEPESLKLDDLLKKEARESRFSGRLGGKAAGRGSAVDAGRSPAGAGLVGWTSP